MFTVWLSVPGMRVVFVLGYVVHPASFVYRRLYCIVLLLQVNIGLRK